MADYRIRHLVTDLHHPERARREHQLPGRPPPAIPGCGPVPRRHCRCAADGRRRDRADHPSFAGPCDATGQSPVRDERSRRLPTPAGLPRQSKPPIRSRPANARTAEHPRRPVAASASSAIPPAAELSSGCQGRRACGGGARQEIYASRSGPLPEAIPPAPRSGPALGEADLPAACNQLSAEPYEQAEQRPDCGGRDSPDGTEVPASSQHHAARALNVSATALTECGCSLAATVHPPASSTGAAADEITPHHGTTRTTITVGARRSAGLGPTGQMWSPLVTRPSPSFGPYSPAPLEALRR
jgi:hypothetical protein